MPLSVMLGTPEFKRLDKTIRFSILNEVAHSDIPGLIFTIVWAYNLEEDNLCMEEIESIFRKVGSDIYYVELQAKKSIRLERNRHEHRLRHKPSKRDIDLAERSLFLSDR